MASKKARFSEAAGSRSSPRRKEKVFIPGERSSPRKRKARGDGEKRAEPSRAVEEDGERDPGADGVELDDDTFKRVWCLE